MKKLPVLLILIFLFLFSGCNNIEKKHSGSVESNIESGYNQANQSNSVDVVSGDNFIESSRNYNDITQSDKPTRIGYTTTEKIQEISGGMTYGKIIEHLGMPETAGFIDGYAQYIVDDDKFLVLRYKNQDEICLLSGNEILNSCLAIDSFFSDCKNNTADALVVGVTGSSITVVTPNYERFSVARFVLPTKYETKTLKIGDLIRITHDDKIAEVYPPSIKIVDMTLIK